MYSKSTGPKADVLKRDRKHGRGDPAYEPSKTKLGPALRRIQRRIIEDGTPLLTPAEVRKEVAERRGGSRP